MSGKVRPGKTFRHHVGQLPVGVGVGEVEDVLLTPVSDDVVADVNVLRPLGRHVVRGHVDTCLVILVEEDRLDYGEAELFEESADPNDRVACVGYSSILRRCR